MSDEELLEPPAEAAPTVDLRGQIELSLQGQAYLLRPSYEAVIAVERELGRGLQVLAAQADVGALSLTDVGIIGKRFIEPAHPEAARWKPGRVGELVYAETGGVHRVQQLLAILLTEAVTGGCTAEGNLKSGEATTSGTAATPDVASRA